MAEAQLYESIGVFLGIAIVFNILACCCVHLGDVLSFLRQCAHPTARGMKRMERLSLFCAGVVTLICSIFSYGDLQGLAAVLIVLVLLLSALVGGLIIWYAYNGSFLGDHEPLFDCDSGGLADRPWDPEERTEKLLGPLESRERVRENIRAGCLGCGSCCTQTFYCIGHSCRALGTAIVEIERLIMGMSGTESTTHARESASSSDGDYLRIEP